MNRDSAKPLPREGPRSEAGSNSRCTILEVLTFVRVQFQGQLAMSFLDFGCRSILADPKDLIIARVVDRASASASVHPWEAPWHTAKWEAAAKHGVCEFVARGSDTIMERVVRREVGERQSALMFKASKSDAVVQPNVKSLHKDSLTQSPLP